MRLVVDGRSNDEIGLSLGLSSKTIESHLTRIFERSDVSSRTELASRAIREGWLAQSRDRWLQAARNARTAHGLEKLPTQNVVTLEGAGSDDMNQPSTRPASADETRRTTDSGSAQ